MYTSYTLWIYKLKLNLIGFPRSREKYSLYFFISSLKHECSDMKSVMIWFHHHNIQPYGPFDNQKVHVAWSEDPIIAIFVIDLIRVEKSSLWCDLGLVWDLGAAIGTYCLLKYSDQVWTRPSGANKGAMTLYGSTWQVPWLMASWAWVKGASCSKEITPAMVSESLGGILWSVSASAKLICKISLSGGIRVHHSLPWYLLVLSHTRFRWVSVANWQ